LTAESFNYLYKPGASLLFDGAPLLGEPPQKVRLARPADIEGNDPDGPVMAAVEFPSGEVRRVLVEHLSPRP
jgi:hypothetical protein